MIEEKNFINLTCHTHFTHFPKPKWQTILEQLLNFRKKLLFLSLRQVSLIQRPCMGPPSASSTLYIVTRRHNGNYLIYL